MTKITPIKTMDELAEYAGKNVRAKALLLGGQKPEPTAWYFEGKLMRAFFGDGFQLYQPKVYRTDGTLEGTLPDSVPITEYTLEASEVPQLPPPG